jgi:hypothetical protein
MQAKQNFGHRFHATYKTTNRSIPEPVPIHVNVLSKQEMQLGQKKDNKFLSNYEQVDNLCMYRRTGKSPVN